MFGRETGEHWTDVAKNQIRNHFSKDHHHNASEFVLTMGQWYLLWHTPLLMMDSHICTRKKLFQQDLLFREPFRQQALKNIF